MAVSKRLRYEILRRDNHTCRYCGGHAPDVSLTVDHVVPTALGGSDQPDNLVTACRDCNAGKSASSPDAPLVADVAADALRWAAALQYAATQAQADLAAERRLFDLIDELWSIWNYGFNGQYAVPRPDDWRDSIRSFVAAGLTPDQLSDAIQKAMTRQHVSTDDVWRYFCGVCWRKADDLRDRAAAYLADQGR